MRPARLLFALVLAGLAVLGYYGVREFNPVTGETQHISLTRDQEIALGLNAAPQMAEQFGGLDPDASLQSEVEAVGRRVAEHSAAGQTAYEFQFHLLLDPQTVNAFALPGGPIFITRGLFSRLENEGQLAGVLGHEVGHVVARHSAERIAKGQLAQTLIGAVGVATSDQQAQAAAGVVAEMVQLRYGRKDELQADSLGVRFMAEAGYDPRALIEVMRILAQAGGGGGQPEFMSTHPDPGNRAALIRAVIERRFPRGVPANLTLGRSIRTETPAP